MLLFFTILLYIFIYLEKYGPFSQKGEGAFCIFLYRLFFYITKAWFLFVFFRDKCCNLFHALLAEFIFL